jgi:hypothetical protein
MSCFINDIYSQDKLRITDIVTNISVDIKEKDFIKCRYYIYRNYTFLAGGIVQKITDSSIVYKGRFSKAKQIPISDIVNIDKVPFRRNIIPAILSGLIAGCADIAINQKRSKVVTSLLITGGVALSLNYVYNWNHRKLNRNTAGHRIRLSVY